MRSGRARFGVQDRPRGERVQQDAGSVYGQPSGVGILRPDAAV
jgi:hypothetical protein